MTLGDFRELTASLPDDTPLATHDWGSGGYHFSEGGENIRIAVTEGHRFDKFPKGTTVIVIGGEDYIAQEV
jgi:hypothetical protein